MSAISGGLVALFKRVKKENCKRVWGEKNILDLNDIEKFSVGAKDVIVNLPWKGIDDGVLRSLLNQFDERRYSVIELRLPFNEVTSNGARLLVEWIEKNPQLAVLDLSHNHKISSEGWKNLRQVWSARDPNGLVLEAGRLSEACSAIRAVSVFQPGKN